MVSDPPVVRKTACHSAGRHAVLSEFTVSMDFTQTFHQAEQSLLHAFKNLINKMEMLKSIIKFSCNYRC